MFIAALSTEIKRWKQPECSPTDEWTNKMWYTHTKKYNLALKRKEILTHATTWMKLEDITPPFHSFSPASPSSSNLFFACRDIPCFSSHMSLSSLCKAYICISFGRHLILVFFVVIGITFAAFQVFLFFFMPQLDWKPPWSQSSFLNP